jgi:asparagine synthase (glutamine-hydrolysing)
MEEANTYSIGFDDPTYNELAYAKEVARHLGVNHVYETIEPEVVHLFDRIIYLLDDPIGDFSVFPTYLVSQVARKHVTVALSGDGGDELFGGYETYIADEKARQYGRVPAMLRRGVVEPWIRSLRPRATKKGFVNKAKRFIEGLEFPGELSHTRWRLFVGEALRDQLFTSNAREQMPTSVGHHIVRLFRRAGARQPVSKSLYVDVKSYLVDNILTKVDRMSMGVSLESRVPLLDKELVELAFRIPDNLKVNNSDTKVLLKRVAMRHVPRHCIYRPKEGFSIPIKNWLTTQLRPMMEELLSAQRIQAEGLFDWSTVARLKAEHLAGSANHSHILWSLMVFQAWRDKWLDVTPETGMPGDELSGVAGGG